MIEQDDPIVPEDSILRSFTAVPLHADVRQELCHCRAMLQSLPVHAAWTLPENMHLTLVFNGDQPGTILNNLIPAIRRSLSSEKTFVFSVCGIGWFGGRHSPRVIWAGIEKGRERVSRLQQKISDATRVAGIEPENRAYHPHITLGRVRRAQQADRNALQKALREFEQKDFGMQQLHCVTLMQSKLTANGVSYSALQRFPLNNNGALPPRRQT